jgi:rhomboid protease GluP
MGWVVGLVIFGLLVPGINNWAHGGGLVSGIMLGFLMSYNEQKGETFFHRVLAAVCILSTAIILLWAVLQALYYSF